MEAVEIKELIEAGVHYGHQRKKWNPKMKPYIYGDKNGVCIIDLSKTYESLEKACEFVKQAASQKKNIVFVGTKKHVSEVIKEEAIRCGVFFINRRWLGGLLTNFDTIRLRLNRLKELEEMQATGTSDRLNKKEQSVFNKELEKLQKTLGGIKNMRGKPDILFVVDQKEEEIAIKEGQKINLKIIALVDTNSDPDGIDYLIPGNDDSARSVRLITKALSDAIIEGRDGHVPNVHDGPASNQKAPVRIIEEITVPQVKEVQEITAVSAVEGEAN